MKRLKKIANDIIYLKDIVDPITIHLQSGDKEEYLVDQQNRDFAILLYNGKIYEGPTHESITNNIEIDESKPCCFGNHVTGKDGKEYVILYQFMDNIDKEEATPFFKEHYPNAIICIEDQLIGDDSDYVIKIAEFMDSFSKNGQYVEVFKNPTTKELGEVLKNDPNNSARGCIDGSDVYVWSSEILHYIINQFVDVSAGGVRFVIEDGYNIVFSNYTSDDQLFNTLNKTKSHFEMLMGQSADKILISSDVDYNFNYASLQDYLNEFNSEMPEKVSRLIKKSDKLYTWEEVCEIQSQGNGRISSLPFGNYGNFKLTNININDLSDYFMTYDEMVDMDLDEDLSILRNICTAIDNGEKIIPVVVDKNMKVVDGSHRLSALYEMGYRNIDAFIEVEE